MLPVCPQLNSTLYLLVSAGTGNLQDRKASSDWLDHVKQQVVVQEGGKGGGGKGKAPKADTKPEAAEAVAAAAQAAADAEAASVAVAVAGLSHYGRQEEAIPVPLDIPETVTGESYAALTKSLIAHYKVCMPSTVCPQLLSALNYCLPSTTVCPQLLFALN